MTASVAGLRARMRKVDRWVADEAWKAERRRISSLSIDEKVQMLREMLPSVPQDHPVRAMAEQLLARRDANASRRAE